MNEIGVGDVVAIFGKVEAQLPDGYVILRYSNDPMNFLAVHEKHLTPVRLDGVVLEGRDT